MLVPKEQITVLYISHQQITTNAQSNLIQSDHHFLENHLALFANSSLLDSICGFIVFMAHMFENEGTHESGYFSSSQTAEEKQMSCKTLRQCQRHSRLTRWATKWVTFISIHLTGSRVLEAHTEALRTPLLQSLLQLVTSIDVSAWEIAQLEGSVSHICEVFYASYGPQMAPVIVHIMCPIIPIMLI